MMAVALYPPSFTVYHITMCFCLPIYMSAKDRTCKNRAKPDDEIMSIPARCCAFWQTRKDGGISYTQMIRVSKGASHKLR